MLYLVKQKRVLSEYTGKRFPYMGHISHSDRERYSGEGREGISKKSPWATGHICYRTLSQTERQSVIQQITPFTPVPRPPLVYGPECNRWMEQPLTSTVSELRKCRQQ